MRATGGMTVGTYALSNADQLLGLKNNAGRDGEEYSLSSSHRLADGDPIRGLASVAALAVQGDDRGQGLLHGDGRWVGGSTTSKIRRAPKTPPRRLYKSIRSRLALAPRPWLF